MCPEITKALSDQAKRSLCTPTTRADRNYYRIMKGELGRCEVECLIYFEAQTTEPDVRRSEIHVSLLTIWTGIDTITHWNRAHACPNGIWWCHRYITARSGDGRQSSTHSAASHVPTHCTDFLCAGELFIPHHTSQSRIRNVLYLTGGSQPCSARAPPYTEHNSNSSAAPGGAIRVVVWLGAGWSEVRNPVEIRDSSTWRVKGHLQALCFSENK